MADLYNLPEAAYTPGGLSILKVVDFDDALAEYKRLRRIATRRLATFMGTEYETSALYQIRKKIGFRTIRDIKKSKRPLTELGAALGDVRGYLESRQSTYTKMLSVNKARVKTLHERGYYFVNLGNLDSFGEFMEAVRMKMGGSSLGSMRAAELYEAAAKKNIPRDELLKDWKYWIDNVEELNKTQRLKGEGKTAADYRHAIERRKERRSKKK